MEKNQFDEMQKQHRGRIGNQMFVILLFSLLIDINLYNFGVRWLEYPANIMVIVVACSSIFLIRLIAANAYLPANSRPKQVLKILIPVVAVSVVVAVLVPNLSISLIQPAAQSTGAGFDAVLVLAVVSIGGLVACGAVAVGRKFRNDRQDQEE